MTTSSKHNKTHPFPIEWTKYSSFQLDDGKVNISKNASHPFPGYIAKPGQVFTAQNTLTHPGHDISAGVSRYCMGDGPELHQKNLEKMGPGWHYATKQVEYHCNSDGYRASCWDDVDWANSIVIFGCSFIYGVGVAQDETVSHYLSELTGRPVINMGYPAGANDLLVNNLAGMINNFAMPHAVIMAWTTFDRFTYYNSYISSLGSWTHEGVESQDMNLGKLYKARNYSLMNKLMETYYTAQHARAMCAGRTKYVTMSFWPDTAHYTRSDIYVKFDHTPEEQRARDLWHAGAGIYKQTANELFQKLIQ